ncbi:stearoyl-CoA desaturase (delta-9 desaturase) [Dyadobacter jejuensis]|uniref:Stearoyl-CoA desaturase (Delta-9 desaturase) n=1 Tax=Dyadobacter jejuensis TaxID=1082580 RepID=A0A316ANK5_9BACT|nr:acyl-CoA desaturase [Dyadobacter jejuensis]PWJ58889.1 stearoyl-CoA desaturase (delta-9 desaturase) [Dyadobacter jejuensis]
MYIVLAVFAVHWYLSLFCQTFFLHRYSAHKMFIMSKPWERFFYLLTYLSQGSSYLSPRAYAILHRMHHAFSDTERDPHSPHHTKNVFTMMWETKDIYNAVLNRKRVIEAQFERNYPEWNLIERLGDSWISRVVWGLLYIAFYLVAFFYLDMHWAFFFLIPIHLLMGPIHGAIVNWSGHKYGYQNFDNQDKSKNSLIFDFLMMGELFQNNHHKRPNSINFGSKWFEIDPTYPVIKLLNRLKIIEIRKKN